ncbi:MAG: hypothetical protein MUC78_10685 [Bacteroidales bacterium]|nr:hypothetical protein [Bacteroidales bacterium]
MCALKNNTVERKPTLKLLIHNLIARLLPASLIESATCLSNSHWLIRELMINSSYT